MYGGEELGQKGGRIEKCTLVVTEQSRDVTCSVGNTVSNGVITVGGARWGLEILGGTLYKIYDCLTTNAIHPKCNME